MNFLKPISYSARGYSNGFRKGDFLFCDWTQYSFAQEEDHVTLFFL